jgi:hypothetical protein
MKVPGADTGGRKWESTRRFSPLVYTCYDDDRYSRFAACKVLVVQYTDAAVMEYTHTDDEQTVEGGLNPPFLTIYGDS